MSGIPATWTLAALPQIATMRMGATILSKHLTAVGVPVFSAGTGDEPWGYTTLDVRRFNRGTLVLSARGTIGNPRLPNLDEFTCTQTTISVVALDAVLSRYLKHQLSAVNWRSLTSGGAIPMLTIGMLSELPISLAPLPEQQRIADKLDTVLSRVDVSRDRLARVAPLLKRFRQSVLAAATSGTFATDRQAWEPALVRLSTITDVVDPNPKHRNPTYQSDGEIFLSTTNFAHPDGWDLTAAKRVSKETVREQQDRCHFTKDSLVFSRKGTIGKVRLVPPIESFALLDSLVVINPKPGLCPRYLLIALQSPVVQDQVVRLTRGVALKQVSVGVVRSLEIPLPSPTEQTEIVRRVETLFAFADRLEVRLAQAQTAVARLTPSLLAKAFRGELVPQDPADEPAAELLKRLAASRTAPAAKPRKPRQGQAA